MWRHSAIATLLLSAPGLAAAASFDGVVALPGVWTLTPDEFQKATPGLPFEWTSSARDSARAAGAELTLFGLPVVEVIARFDSGKLSELTANFYARGDAGNLSRERFDALVKNAADAVSKASGVKFTVRGKDPGDAVRAEGLLWKTPAALYLLEYSFTREMKSRDIPFRAEFVRLQITPPPVGAASLLSAAPVVKRFNAAPHLQRDVVTGDVWIKDLPMVDQGQKGYCVTASAERVLRYYGKSVDANELAQISNSDTNGTTYDGMLSALKKVGNRMRLHIREIEKLEPKDVLAIIKDYNRVAKSTRAAEIPDPGYMIDLDGIYSAMQGDILRLARNKRTGDVERFQRAVKDSIEKGIPLLWMVYLGLFPEPGVPQSGGAHMRVVIGHNPKTNDILFTDSWGAGYELKRMTLADAFTITCGLTTIEPL